MGVPVPVLVSSVRGSRPRPSGRALTPLRCRHDSLRACAWDLAGRLVHAEWRLASAPQDHAVLVEAVAAEVSRRVLQRQEDRAGGFTDDDLWVDAAVWADVVQQVQAAWLMLLIDKRLISTYGLIIQ
mgnify:CR=1 FL=1